MAGAVVVSKVPGGSSARLALSTSSDLSSLIYSSSVAVTGGVVRNEITGLADNTQYFYALEIDGRLQKVGNIGRFRTKPAPGAASFKFGFSSCARTGSRHPVFNDILQEDLLLFLHLGDLYYADVAADDSALVESYFDRVMASPEQARLYREVPTFYMFHNHDYGLPADSTAPSKPATLATWRKRVPHPPLAFSGSSDPVGYSFVVGRVRFILPDMQSSRTDNTVADNSSKTTMGPAQTQWLKDEMLAAEAAGQVIVWARTTPWNLDFDHPEYNYNIERTGLANFIRDEGLIGRICIVTADRHSSGIDDGTNSDYATGGGSPIPTFMAGPLDQANLPTFGTYSEGEFNTNEHCYGVVEITDTGGATIGVTQSLKAYGEGVVLSHTFTLTP